MEKEIRYVNEDGVRLRLAPDTTKSEGVIKELKCGEEVSILNVWYEVDCARQHGLIRGDKLNLEKIIFTTVEDNIPQTVTPDRGNSFIEDKRILRSPVKCLICTQKFGARPEVYKNYGSPKGHNGLDFRTWVDNDPNNWEQPIFSVLDGIVSQSDFDPKFNGNYVRVKHDNQYESVYLHLSKRVSPPPK